MEHIVAMFGVSLKAFSASISLHSSLEEDLVTHFCHAWYQEYEAMLREALGQA